MAGCVDIETSDLLRSSTIDTIEVMAQAHGDDVAAPSAREGAAAPVAVDPVAAAAAQAWEELRDVPPNRRLAAIHRAWLATNGLDDPAVELGRRMALAAARLDRRLEAGGLPQQHVRALRGVISSPQHRLALQDALAGAPNSELPEPMRTMVDASLGAQVSTPGMQALLKGGAHRGTEPHQRRTSLRDAIAALARRGVGRDERPVDGDMAAIVYGRLRTHVAHDALRRAATAMVALYEHPEPAALKGSVWADRYFSADLSGGNGLGDLAIAAVRSRDAVDAVVARRMLSPRQASVLDAGAARVWGQRDALAHTSGAERRRDLMEAMLCGDIDGAGALLGIDDVTGPRSLDHRTVQGAAPRAAGLPTTGTGGPAPTARRRAASGGGARVALAQGTVLVDQQQGCILVVGQPVRGRTGQLQARQGWLDADGKVRVAKTTYLDHAALKAVGGSLQVVEGVSLSGLRTGDEVPEVVARSVLGEPTVVAEVAAQPEVASPVARPVARRRSSGSTVRGPASLT